MAQSPDPNRRSGDESDPELQPRYERQEGGIGNIPTTRMNFPSWLSVVLLVVVVAVIIALMLRTPPS